MVTDREKAKVRTNRINRKMERKAKAAGTTSTIPRITIA
jgi:hypothetical protein